MKRINQQYIFDNTQEGFVQPMDGYSPVIFYDYGDYVKTTALCCYNFLKL